MDTTLIELKSSAFNNETFQALTLKIKLISNVSEYHLML